MNKYDTNESKRKAMDGLQEGVNTAAQHHTRLHLQNYLRSNAVVTH